MRLFEVGTSLADRTTAYSLSDIVDHYGDIIEAYKGMPKLYRGMSIDDDNAYIMNLSGMTRKSANTLNYATLIFNKLPSWRGWPPRSESISCSPGLSMAGGYGRLFYIIPLENQPVAQQKSGMDFWYTFSKTFKEYNLSDMNISDFNDRLDYIAHKYGFQLSETNADVLVDQLTNLQKVITEGELDEVLKSRNKLYHLFFNKTPIMETLNKLFDPNEVCHKSNYPDVTFSDNNEVWLSGQVLAIPVGLLDDL